MCSKESYHRNIFALIHLPWVLVTWGVMIVGLLFLFLFQLPVQGMILLAVAMAMMLFWVLVINQRARAEPKKKEIKRKNKHPAYRPLRPLSVLGQPRLPLGHLLRAFYNPRGTEIQPDGFCSLKTAKKACQPTITPFI